MRVRNAAVGIALAVVLIACSSSTTVLVASPSASSPTPSPSVGDVVSRQLGHANISTTANVYTHDTDAAATEAAQIVGRDLEGGTR